MSAIRLALAALVVAILAACGGGDPEPQSNCPQDTAPQACRLFVGP